MPGVKTDSASARAASAAGKSPARAAALASPARQDGRKFGAVGIRNSPAASRNHRSAVCTRPFAIATRPRKSPDAAVPRWACCAKFLRYSLLANASASCR